MVLNFYLEAAVLPIDILLCVYLRVKYRDTSDIDRRYRHFCYAVLIATFCDVLYAIIYDAHGLRSAFLYTFVDTVAHMTAYFASIFFLRYIVSYPANKTLERRLVVVTGIVSVFYVVLWVANFFTGTIVAYDEYGYFGEGPLFLVMVFGMPFLVIFTAFVIHLVYRSAFGRWQRTAIGLTFVTGIIVYLLQTFFFRETLIIFFIAAAGLYFIFFCLETPMYMQLSGELEALHEERERAEEENQNAQEANLTKSAFLDRMSQEIRTPVNTIFGIAQQMAKESKEEEVTRYVKEITNSGARLSATINDVLDYSRMETGKLRLQPSHYHLGRVLFDLEKTFSQKAREKGIRFHMQLSPTLTDELYGDEVRVTQILTSLLNNAVTYTQQGTVTLSVAGKRHFDKVHLHISVTDTGCGIKEEEMPYLFESFRHLEGVEYAGAEGAGLGLAIAKKLCDMMEGTIDVQSVYGRGSTFRVMLPQSVVGDKTVGEYDLDRHYQSANEKRNGMQ